MISVIYGETFDGKSATETALFSDWTRSRQYKYKI